MLRYTDIIFFVFYLIITRTRVEGLLLSIFFSVFLLDDITWVDAPTEQYPIAGSSYKVRCKVKADPAPLIDWYKQDARIQDGNGFVKDIDGLLIQNVTAEDDGIYKCRAIVLDTGSILDRDIRVEVRSYYTVHGITMQRRLTGFHL
jgi:neurocan core protein